ncbi:MAG: response regulator [Polyangiaceae bacterium]|nr:response regulator [Polyangiaceae bacterium]
MHDPVRVMIVDDDASQLELLDRSLRSHGFDVLTCNSPIGVTNLICSFEPDVVLMDVNIPALSGDRLLSICRKWAPASTRFVLFSSWDETKLRGLARSVGADGYLSKSVTGLDLATKVRAIANSKSG